MIRISLCICFCSFIVFSSCKKEKLNGELTSLIEGDWVWFKSTRTIMNDNKDVVFASSTDRILKLKEKGQLQVLKNDDCLRKHRIKEVEAEEINSIPESIRYFLTLNKKDGYSGLTVFLDITGESDTLFTGKENDFFGIDLPNDDYLHYLHYFIRK